MRSSIAPNTCRGLTTEKLVAEWEVAPSQHHGGAGGDAEAQECLALILAGRGGAR
jgi:hypothetical protein